MAAKQESGPRAKCDQVIFEAISKAAEIIVNGRSATCASTWDTRNGAKTSRSSEYGRREEQANQYSGCDRATSSGRFNLIVPEVPEVREILQRWRRALHVPLRIDLFYQSPMPRKHCCNSEISTNDQPRHLLERWCLEYIPTKAARHHHSSASDPIVQLRHVCKLIVIWLRNLYCSSRLLPSQTFKKRSWTGSGNDVHNCIPQIGFSIYVLPSSDDQDCVSTKLMKQQGFRCQDQPSGVVTPYGDLAWKVYYAPKADIDFVLKLQGQSKAPSIILSSISATAGDAAACAKFEREEEPQQHQQQQSTLHHGRDRNLQYAFGTISKPSSKSVAIPRDTGDNDIDHNWGHNEDNVNHGYSGLDRTPIFGMPQSAPTGGAFLAPSNRDKRDIVRTDNTNPLVPSQSRLARNTYEDKRDYLLQHGTRRTTNLHHSFMNDNNREGNFTEMQSPRQQEQHHEHWNLLQRRNTSIGIGREIHGSPAFGEHRVGCSELQQKSQDNRLHYHKNLHQQQPERSMSGLSLALMAGSLSDSEEDCVPAAAEDTAAQTGNTLLVPTIKNKASVSPVSLSVEKRRAALHHAAPHQQQQFPPYGMNEFNKSVAVGGDYGYAYNNHISWQQIRPSANLPVSLPGKNSNDFGNDGKLTDHGSSQRSRLNSSPSLLVGTPPSGAFLSRVAGGGTGNQSPNSLCAASFISPRTASAAPPFPLRSPGFVDAEQNPPSSSPLEFQAKAHIALRYHPLPDPNRAFDEVVPRMTSLDHLHSSPFRHGASALSSLSIIGSPEGNLSALATPSCANTIVVRPPSPVCVEEGPDDDMPFAVDVESSISYCATTNNQQRPLQSHSGATPSSHAGFESILCSVSNSPSLPIGLLAADSSYLASSAASFAQKCAPAQHRLKLFAGGLSESTTTAKLSTTFGNTSVGGDLSVPDLQRQRQESCYSSDEAKRTDAASASFPTLSSQLAEFHNFGASNSLSPAVVPVHLASSKSVIGGSQKAEKAEYTTKKQSEV